MPEHQLEASSKHMSEFIIHIQKFMYEFMPASNSEFIHEFFSMNSKTNSDHEEYQPSLWQCYCPRSPPLRLQRFCCRG